MTSATGSANSCAYADTRINSAKCTLRRMINGTGDADFGIGRFRATCSGMGGCTTGAGACDNNSSNAIATQATFGEVLVGVGDNNSSSLLPWLDNNGNSCLASCATPELVAGGNTPIGGSLYAVKEYYLNNLAGFTSPIVTDRATPTRIDQCRPYRAIILTDGGETCNGSGQAAATSLRTTTVSAQNYDVKTFVIGFGTGLAAADITNLNNIATNGGTDASGGTGGAHAFFATNEATLSAAFSKIVQDSLLVEVCNGVDDNCNGQIDEGFTKYCNKRLGIMTPTLCVDPGDVCGENDNNCVNGNTDQTGRNACGTCGPAPAEVCNGVDDNCDGFIDIIPGTPPIDVCGGCVPSAEICDGKDNDCDGRIDEGLTRQCGSTIAPCSLGTQACIEQLTPQMMGTWGPCSGIAPTAEICDGIDNDCDGVIDGITRPCGVTMGQCQAGTEICIAGSFQGCSAVTGTTEICDGIDNNCNGMTDEGDPGGGANCTDPGVCGSGVVHCVGGRLTCVGTMMASPEICNGIDDDCDGNIDNGVPDMGSCGSPVAGECHAGTMKCVAGRFQCIGYVGPKPETCNCLDDNCDGTVDDPPAGGSLCPTGSSCVDCQCAQPCGVGEFPCPSGKRCRMGFCVADPCQGITCPASPDGTLNVCQMGNCVTKCSTTTCQPNEVCRKTDGACVTDNCTFFPDKCSATQLCRAGTCVTDACIGVSCDAGKFCRDGQCISSCAGVTCTVAGEACKDGACVATGCAQSCGFGQVCNPTSHNCQADRCTDGTVQCSTGLACDPVTGQCMADLCIGITCPTGQTCKLGECNTPQANNPDAGVIPTEHTKVLATGQGGCACDAGGDTTTNGVAAGIFAAIITLWLSRRRKTPVRVSARRRK